MRDQELRTSGGDLEHYFRLLMRQKWFLILPVVFLVTLTAIITLFMPNKYSAKSIILVEPQSIPTKFMSSALPYGPETYFRSLVEQIKSHSMLEKVILKYNLYSELRRSGTMEDAVNLMAKNINIESKGRDTFSVAFTHSDPQLAQQVTNTLTDMFIDENLNFRLERSRKNVEFLQSQAAKLRQDLVEQEKRVQEYKAQNLNRLPEQRAATQAQLNGARERLFSLSEALAAAQANASSSRQLGRTRDAQQSGRAGESVTLARKLEVARQELRHLRNRFSDRHPDVKLKQKEVQALQEQLNAMRSPTPDLGAKGGGRRPAARKVSRAERNEDLKVQRLQEEINHLQEQIALYTTRLEETPGVELELSKLTSGLEVLRSQADSYQEKATDAAASLAMEEANQGSQFRAIDRAQVPNRPISPNRPLLIAISAVLGIFIGLLLVIAMDILFRTFLEEQDLTAYTGIPVLVAIPNVGPLPSEWQRFRGQVSNLLGYLLGSLHLAVDDELIDEDRRELPAPGAPQPPVPATAFDASQAAPMPPFDPPQPPAPLPAFGAPQPPAPMPAFGAPQPPAPLPAFGAPPPSAPRPADIAPAEAPAEPEQVGFYQFRRGSPTLESTRDHAGTTRSQPATRGFSGNVFELIDELNASRDRAKNEPQSTNPPSGEGLRPQRGLTKPGPGSAPATAPNGSPASSREEQVPEDPSDHQSARGPGRHIMGSKF